MSAVIALGQLVRTRRDLRDEVAHNAELAGGRA